MLSRLNPNTNRRHEHRALNAVELSALIVAQRSTRDDRNWHGWTVFRTPRLR